MSAICDLERVQLYRKLKQARDRLQAIEKAIEEFPGTCDSSDLMILGGLRAKHYITRMNIQEIEEALNGGEGDATT